MPRPGTDPAQARRVSWGIAALDRVLRHASASVVRGFCQTGPLVGPLFVGALLLAVCTTSRLFLVALHLDRLHHVERFGRLFSIGLRMDLILACYCIAPLAICALLLPTGWVWRAASVFVSFGTGVILLVTLLECITPSFIAEYDERPNRLVVELFADPREILATIWADDKWELVGLVLVLDVAAWITWRLLEAAFAGCRAWGLGRRLLFLPLVLATLGLGARGTLGHQPANISTAAFCVDRLANELALNSTYALGYALYALRHDDSASALYGSLSREEIFAGVAAFVDVPPGDGIPFLHRTEPRTEHAPYNLVIVLEESLGAEFVGRLGGLPLTPNLDRLAERGLWLTSLYSTGTRTVMGIEGIVSGFLPTPGRGVVKLPLSQRGFFTVAGLLQKHGYATEFVYGGESHFDNMRSFFLGNGFETVHDEATFSDVAFHGTWGVSDEDLFRRANATFAAHGEQPFFALVLTTSNHKPFEFPDGRIDLYEEPKQTRLNAIKYADYALGEFFRLAGNEAYFARTIFLVVADHDIRTYGSDAVPVARFHIPGLILGPGVAPGQIEAVASQIDLMPTVLPLLGLTLEQPMIGRDLLARPPGDPGRAIMQFYRAHAFMAGDRVAVHLPHEVPQFFHYARGRLEPMPADPLLGRQALAHAHLPALLYRERSYRLP